MTPCTSLEGAPLEILIIGAGIGGLSAALAFRRQGHNVTILESSRFSNETGAAIHVAPNCNGLLRRMGVDMEQIGANEFQHLNMYNAPGQPTASMDLVAANSIWQHKWLLVHRAHLHTALRKCAISDEGQGRPCRLKLASRVLSIDPRKASATLRDGETVSGDVLLGADGVHSLCRKYLESGDRYEPFDSGQSSFRSLIPIQALRDDPRTKDLIGPPGTLSMNMAADRRIVTYPCVRNTLMNMLLIHPSELTRSEDAGYNQSGDKAKMLEIASCFSPEWLALLEKAPEDTLKVWTLLDMGVLPTWIKENMALLGDAAHPFLPHQAQGGAQAIEDAVSLAALMPLGTAREDVPERLELYETCRRERANKIQEYTRISGMSPGELKRHGITDYKPIEFTAYNVNRDEWDFSSNALKQHLYKKSPAYRWRQTLSFGPSPGPRQPLNRFPGTLSYARQHQLVHSIRFHTSRTYLEHFLPNEQFSFAAPGTLAQASFVMCSLRNMVWLGDTGYNHCGLYIHGVQYTKKNGEKVNGTFMPMLFEDLADPIVTGREELGMPKWFCDIELEETPISSKVTMSWRGATFGELEFNDLDEKYDTTETGRNTVVPKPKPMPDDGIFIYRYIPAVGEPGKADAEYTVFDPYVGRTGAKDRGPGLVAEQEADGHIAQARSRFSTDGATNTKVAKSASVRFQALDWHSLPTVHHIAEGFAGVPVYEVLEAKVDFVPSVSDLAGAYRVE